MVMALTSGFTWIPLYIVLFIIVMRNNETIGQISVVIHHDSGDISLIMNELSAKNADIKKMRKKIIKIRKIAQKQFTKEKNTNII